VGRDVTGKDGGPTRKVTRGGTCHDPCGWIVLEELSPAERVPLRNNVFIPFVAGAFDEDDRPRDPRTSAAEALVRPAFGPLERASFRMLGIRQFMTLRSRPPNPDQERRYESADRTLRGCMPST
jgi:hypothetical protein